MPYLDGYELYDSTVAAASHDLNIPTHATGDILVACINADGTGALGLPTSTGGGTWVSVQQTTSVGGQSNRLVYLVCTSSDETCTVTLTTETVAAWVGCVKGNGGTLAYDTSTKRGTDDSTEPFDGIAITPGVVKTLVLQFLTSDGGIGPMIQPPIRNIAACDTAANSVGAALMYAKTTDAIAAKNWYSGAGLDGTMALAITLKDDGSESRVPAYLDSSSVITYGYNGGNTTKNGWTWDTTTPYPIACFKQRDFDQVWSFNGTSTYTDETTDAISAATADVTMTNAVDAALYFGYSLPFEGLNAALSTAMSGGTVAWEYWNGSTWTALTSVVGSFTSTGNRPIYWKFPKDWATTSVNSVTKYWVRFRLVSAPTTTPVLNYAWCGGGVTIWITTSAAADSHQLPYANSMQCITTQSTALNYTGMSVLISSAVDWSTGVFIMHHRCQLSRDYKVDICKAHQDYPATAIRRRIGLFVIFVDSDGDYEGYAIHSKQSESTSANDFNTVAIAINDGAIPCLVNGTFNPAAIKSIYIQVQSEFGPMTFYVNGLSMVGNCVLAGGGVGGANPIDFDEFCECVNNSIMYSNVLAKTEDAARVYVPLQLGGGDSCNISMDGKVLTWPQEYNGQTQHAYNGDDDVLNFIMYGKTTDDYFVFTNCAFTAGQPQIWGFHASHSANATVDFTNTKVQGFNVVLRSTVTLATMTFAACPSFDLNSAVVSECTFIDTKVSVDAPADAEDLTDCSFTSSGTGHAIEIGGTAANFTLSDLIFTGYAASDGSTGNEAIYINIATGSVTISIAGGGNTPSIRTAGASTNVVSGSVTVSITAQTATGTKISSANVFLAAADAGPYPYQDTVAIVNSGTTATVTHSAHNLASNDKILIQGASLAANNGVFSIALDGVDPDNKYSYTMDSSPGSNPTGATATYVLIKGTTDTNGYISMSRVFSGNQPIYGWTRKASGSPYYKEGPVSGTVSSSENTAFTAIMTTDGA